MKIEEVNPSKMFVSLTVRQNHAKSSYLKQFFSTEFRPTYEDFVKSNIL